jgi:hypothetical protein
VIPKGDVDVKHSLESTWVLQAPLGLVWDNLYDPLRWPVWWPFIQQIQLLQVGKAQGLEALYAMNGQELRVCAVRAMELLEFCTEQVLARWSLEHEEGHTFVYLSMWGCFNELRFAQAMSAGAKGLAEHLGVRLLEAGSWNAATDQSIFP